MQNVDYLQLSVLAGEALLVAALLLILFRLRSRFGLSLVFVALGVLQPIQVQLSASMYIELAPDLNVSPGSIILFASSLFAVLLVYIREDATAVRRVIYGLVTANLCVSLLYVVFGRHFQLETTKNLLGVPPGLYLYELRVMIAGTVALLIDSILIILVYEALGRFARRAPFIRIYLTLAAVLAVDSLIFATGGFLGKPIFVDVLVSGLMGKALFSLLFAAALSIYLRYIEPAESSPLVETHGQLKDVFHALSYREKNELQRQQNQASLDRAAQRKRLILDATTDGILAIDSEDRIVGFNSAGEKTLGAEHGELSGMHISTILDSKRVQDALAGGPLPEGVIEVTGTRCDGSQFPAELGIVRDTTESGEEFILSLRDISERKQLYEKKLQASKMETVGLLASGVTHDFNNLLTVIRGASAIAREQANREGRDVSEILMLEDAADRAAQLTSQLLSYARKQVLRPTVVDLNETVRKMQGMLARLLPKEVSLETELAPDLHAVFVSEGLLDQVILNLVTNARDAMPTGGKVRIVTSNGESDELGPCVFLRVEDAGVGIPDRVLPRIFEPYFTTKDVGKGTGLGLSMCGGIVEQSGGTLTAESRLGEGAIFTVTLPSTTEQPLDAPPSVEPTASESTTSSILLVEDNEPVLRLTSRILRSAGHDVLAAKDGEEALAQIRDDKIKIDLLVTDIVMPGMRGDTLARQIRAHRPEVRVLFMSGHAKGVTDGFLVKGPLLCKPFSPSELLKHVALALDGDLGTQLESEASRRTRD